MENLVLHRFQVRSKSLKYCNTSKKEKNSASALLTAVVNVRRQTLQQTSEAVVQQVRFLILAGTTKSTWSKSFFENLILFTNHFFNPTTPSLQNTLCYKFSRTICRDLHYKLKKLLSYRWTSIRMPSLSTTLFWRQQIGWKHTCEIYLYLQKIVFNM